jgi:hypothetical protein
MRRKSHVRFGGGLLEKWSIPGLPDPDAKPFGLNVGDSLTWHGLVVTRREVLGPNWSYLVLHGDQTYKVNVFNPETGAHRILVHGTRQATQQRIYIREDVNARVPEEALIEALMRVLQLPSTWPPQASR